MASSSFIQLWPKRVLSTLFTELSESRRRRLPIGHDKLVSRLHTALDAYVKSRSLGRLWVGVEVVLDQREDIILQPDITFIVDGRESIVSDRVWGPPDMVLEVTSPLTHPGQLEERVAWFSLYGVREYWLVQPQQKDIAILELAHGAVRRRRLFDDIHACHISAVARVRSLLGRVSDVAPASADCLSDRKNLFEVVCGARDDVDADELAHAPGGGRACVGCRFHRCDIAAHDGGHQAGVDFLPADEHDVGSLHHRVGRFHHADKASRFDEAERFAELGLGRGADFSGGQRSL